MNLSHANEHAVASMSSRNSLCSKSSHTGAIHNHRISKHSLLQSSPTRQYNTVLQYGRQSQHIMIGFIFGNGEASEDQYKCRAPACSRLTFGRLAELKRHNACRHGGHDGKLPQFWCPVEKCERSKTGQGGAFPRKDKMFDHLSRMHANIVGS